MKLGIEQKILCDKSQFLKRFYFNPLIFVCLPKLFLKLSEPKITLPCKKKNKHIVKHIFLPKD